MWEKSVLLRFVEAMCLIDEQHGLPAAGALLLRHADGFSNVLDTGQHRGKGYEPRVRMLGEHARERRFTGARRPPQDHGMQSAAVQHAAQGRIRTEQMLLSVESFQTQRARALRQRPVGNL